MKGKHLKSASLGHRHPYTDYEADRLWPLIEKGVADLVENKDLVEKTERKYIVGYLCRVILKGEEGGPKKL
jgi:hypothetical protein